MRFIIPKNSELDNLPLKERLFWQGFHQCRLVGGQNTRLFKAVLGRVPNIRALAHLPLKTRLFWQGFYFCRLGGQNRKTGKIPRITKSVFFTSISPGDFYKLYQYLPPERRIQVYRDYDSVCPPGDDRAFQRRSERRRKKNNA